jgi:serine phosphatase RsbU (regulator of sigma subunit)/anti-sigma regulatory factor (Ser/Thr protein kinase)
LAERQLTTRLANYAFLLFFGVYAAASIVWLLSGIPPVLAAHSSSIHAAFHRWGGGDRAYLVASAGTLNQKAAPSSRAQPAKELAFRAATPVVVQFENADAGVAHNLSIYRDSAATDRVFRGPVTTRKATVDYRFTLPTPGTYFFRDDLHPNLHGTVTVVDRAAGPPAWLGHVPGVAAIARGAAVDAHLVRPTAEVILSYLFSLLSVALGVLLISIRTNDLAARLLALGMVGTAAVFNFTGHALLEEIPGLAVPIHDNFHIAAGLAYVYALMVFPDGRLVPRWTRRHWFRWPLRIAYFVAITWAVLYNKSRLHGDPTGFVLFFGVLIPVAGITSQALRLRRASSATERQQSRVLIWALSIALGVALLLAGLGLVIGKAALEAQTEAQLKELPFLVFPVLFAMIPITLTAVLVRYRLWDIDRVINQTLVYGALTGVLAVVYVISVGLLLLLLSPLTRKSNLALIGSTLAVAALARPLRDRVQSFIDRRFYRSRYDAARTLEAFSASVLDEIDLDTITSELRAVVQQTMQPARVTLWLRPEADQPPDDLGGPIAIDRDDPLVTHLEAVAGPLDLDQVEIASPARDALRTAGVRLVVPLVSRGKLIALLNLGPRLSDRPYSGDDRKLLHDLAAHAAPALRVARLLRQEEVALRDQGRLQEELRVAQLIQQRFLPRELPDLPGWKVTPYYRPARAVGGDFYDFIELPKGQVGIVIGDVTDKGVPAALVMATTHSILRAEAPRLVVPARVLQRANDLLVPDIPPNMFVTCLYGVLDPATGKLRFANAGHSLPYAQTAAGVVELRATGVPLGLLPEITYEEKNITLAPGDTLLLHSDGLIEAHDPERRMYGCPRLVRLLGAGPGGQELIGRLLADLDGFTGSGWEQEDDITLVTMQREAGDVEPRPGSDGEARRVLAEFELASRPGNERVAVERVAEAVQRLELPERRLDRLKTAVGEAAMNAIEHGNAGRPELPVRVRVTLSEADLSVWIVDQGGPRPLPEAETPEVEAKLDGRQAPRGWGLFLIKQMVDELRTSVDGQHHTVELVVHLKAADGQQ